LTEKTAEDISLFMAQNRDAFAKAFKSNLDALSELMPGNAAV
jgi:dsDNA-binding SOS-regulon protein